MLSRLLITLLGWRSPRSLLARGKSHTLLEVARPFPRKLRGERIVGTTSAVGLGPWALRDHPGAPLRRRVYSCWPFVKIGRWRQWYFPQMLTVWRKRDRASVTFWPWINLRTWLFTRCEGCGKRGPYGHSPVHRNGHDPITKSILLGRTGCYWHGCKPNPTVEYRNTDAWDRQWGHDIYLRRTVLHEPIDVAVELAALRRVAHDAEGAYRRRLAESRREHGIDAFVYRWPAEAEGPPPTMAVGG